MQGRPEPNCAALCGVGTKELCINRISGLLTHDPSWKATCSNFELPDFLLAVSHEGSAVVAEFLIPGILPWWADVEDEQPVAEQLE